MAISFHAVLRKRASDKDGAGTITFDYPASDAKDADIVGHMTNQVLIVTVMTEDEATLSMWEKKIAEANDSGGSGG